ncbi:MAG: hypothetical protein JO326_03195, partial [Acetobacteraceae bacterium]|nr:hypothetical protein [Acetobacteraceae bacterium]
MTPGPTVSWRSLALDAHLHGPFTRPDVDATAHLVQLAAAGAGVGDFALTLHGQGGRAALRAIAAGLQVPGPKPDAFASAPVQLTADARLDAPDRPVAFTLTHPLVTLKGNAQTAGTITVAATLGLPDLAPLAAVGGMDLAGHADLDLHGRMAGDSRAATLDGHLAITGGVAPAPALVGNDATVGVTASMTGNDVTLSRFAFNGSNASLGASGTLRDNAMSLTWNAALGNLALVAPTLTGALAGGGHIEGPTGNFAATAALQGTLGTAKFPPGPIAVALNAKGLPNAPAGAVTANGTVEGAPLTLAAEAARNPDGALAMTIERAAWKSAHAQGALTLPPNTRLPLGHVTLAVDDLSDFSALAGQPLGGRVDADADLAADLATLALHARNAAGSGADVRSADLTARIAHPLDHADVQAQLVIQGVRSGAVAGDVRLDAAGPQNALGLRLQTALQNFNGAPLRADSSGTLDVDAMDLRVANLDAAWKGEQVRLLAPTRVSLKDGLSLDRTRIGVGAAELTAEGKVSPVLDLTASARNVTPALARPFAPGFADAAGTIAADARLTGTPAQPSGTVRLTAAGLRLRQGPAASLPPVNGTATATLDAGAAQVDARVTAGPSSVTVEGRVMPTLDVTAAVRNVSPALAAPFAASLAGSSGTIAADAHLTGTPAHPAGTVRLTASDIRDRNGAAAGLPPANLIANATLAGTAAQIDGRLTAGANRLTVAGTAPLAATGALGLRADGRVDLAVLNPLIGANGERAEGTLSLGANIGGTPSAPAIVGEADLSRGDFQDFAAGIHLGSIEAA